MTTPTFAEIRKTEQWITLAFDRMTSPPEVVWMTRKELREVCYLFQTRPNYRDPGKIVGRPIVLIDQPPAVHDNDAITMPLNDAITMPLNDAVRTAP